MNKRIRELANKILPNEKELHQGDPKDWAYFFSGDELEKFAQLILQECVKFVEPTEEHRRDASWGFLGGEEGVELLDGIVAEMKQHFGVCND